MNGGGRLYFPGLASFYATMEPIAYTITRVVTAHMSVDASSWCMVVLDMKPSVMSRS